MKKYLYNLLVACDQWLNTLLGGDEDMCISSRLALNHYDSWLRKTVDWLFFYHQHHCQRSLGRELAETFNDSAILR